MGRTVVMLDQLGRRTGRPYDAVALVLRDDPRAGEVVLCASLLTEAAVAPRPRALRPWRLAAGPLTLEPGHEEVEGMRAEVGQRLVVRARHQGEPDRDGEVLEVRGSAGGPPYVVRWSDDGHVSLIYPGADAYVASLHPHALVQSLHPHALVQ